MYNNAPKNYECPICIAVNGIENEKTMIMQQDIVYRDELVMALVNSKFIPGNEGHVIVVPVEYYENIYGLPEKTGHRIIDVSKKIAIAMKEIRKCDGITILQNNEPAGGQHAFHYHLHVFPRFDGDNLYGNMSKAYVSKQDERNIFSTELREGL